MTKSEEMPKILVTGGLGYIGSHTSVVLLEKGFRIVIVDSLINSSIKVLDHIRRIVPKGHVEFELVDMCDAAKLEEVFEKHDFDVVIHFAALKAVGESAKKPLCYYHQNIISSINLLEAMDRHNVRQLVYSSSATVYGDATQHPNMVPIPENCPLEPNNVYGRTKLYVEKLIEDYSRSTPQFNACLLRYFNPAGAHPSGMLGEDPLGIPNNLLPYIAQVASKRLEELVVFGNEYKSKDGTPIRDYVHIMDLAEAHVRAMMTLQERHVGCRAWNIGTGQGYTVLDIIKGFEHANSTTIPWKFGPPREGDVLILVAKTERANKELNWEATRSLDDICTSMWRWHKMFPLGFSS